MPKHPNHACRRPQPDSTRSAGWLQLPSYPYYSRDPWDPRRFAPRGWDFRLPVEGWARMYIYAALVAVGFLVLIFGCAALITLLQHLLGSH